VCKPTTNAVYFKAMASSGPLDVLIKIVQSPPGQVAAGFVLSAVVFKFFQAVESVLTEDTKLEIALWLLGVRAPAVLGTGKNRKTTNVRKSFVQLFDRYFGTDHLSWKCFKRSSLASYSAALLGIFAVTVLDAGRVGTVASLRTTLLALPTLLLGALIGNVLPDYFSLLETRFALQLLDAHRQGFLMALVIVVGDLFVTAFIAGLAATLALNLAILASGIGLPYHLFQTSEVQLASSRYLVLWFWPAFWTSLWLWLYVGAGWIVQLSVRTNFPFVALGRLSAFNWFTSHFDIERKPLQSLGLVAAALVLLAWFAAVLMVRLL